MHLESVYDTKGANALLYELLAEREPSENISHKEMPCFGDHVRFVESNPYQVWYFMMQADRPVGACYLTKQNEIGVFTFKKCRGNGYGREAVSILMSRHPKARFLANINPDNQPSMAMFHALGFKVCQVTLAK